MSWLLPLNIGLIMGLILAWPAMSFAASFRLLGFPDLTLEGAFPTGAAIYAVAMQAGLPLGVALLFAMVAGALLGAVTAIIHLTLGVNKFLAGILVVGMSYTLDLRVMNGSNIGLFQKISLFNFARSFDDITGSSFQLGAVIMLATMLFCGVALLLGGINSAWGIRLRVAGSNPKYAEALGLNAPALIVTGIAISNALIAGSGALLAMYQGFSDVALGQGALVFALASMTIGEHLVPEIRLPIPAFVVIAAIAGSVAYQILLAYAVRLGLAATDLKLATAIFVLIVIALKAKAHDDEFLEVIR